MSENRLPFEPGKNKKKKKEVEKTNKITTKSSQKQNNTKKTPRVSKEEASLSAIPDVVAKRMGLRMAFFSGIPTFMGIASFFVFYWLLSKDILEFPPYLVVFVTAGFFGLGVIGLSYGIFSSSWDENNPGGLIGFSEFKLNFKRTVSAWKKEKKATKH